MKSYDTAWATMLIRQYLAPDGYVVSLQNCMNEETIAGIVGWGKTLGCIASSITVDLPEPGHVHRGAGQARRTHTVFRVGEVHGRITERAEEVCRLVALCRQRQGHQQSLGRALVEAGRQRRCGNGLSACTGLRRRRDAAERADPPLLHPARQRGDPRRPGARLSARGDPPPAPEIIARAGEGDEAAMHAYDEQRFEDSQAAPRPASAPRWARTCRRAAAPRSSSSTASSCARARSSASPAAPTRR